MIVMGRLWPPLKGESHMEEKIKNTLAEINKMLGELIAQVEYRYRPVTPDDFKNFRQPKAMFFNPRGNAYLENGKWYYLRYMEKRNKVSVPASCNYGMASNAGVEFSMKNFYVEREDNDGCQV